VTAAMLESGGYRASFGDNNCGSRSHDRTSNLPPSSSAFPGSYSALAGVAISPIPFRTARPFPHSPGASADSTSSRPAKRQRGTVDGPGSLAYLSSNVTPRPRYSVGTGPGVGMAARTSEPQTSVPTPMPAQLPMPMPVPDQRISKPETDQRPETDQKPETDQEPETDQKPETDQNSETEAKTTTPDAQLTRSHSRPALHLAARPGPGHGHGHGHTHAHGNPSVRSRFDSDPLLRPLSPITPANEQRSLTAESHMQSLPSPRNASKQSEQPTFSERQAPNPKNYKAGPDDHTGSPVISPPDSTRGGLAEADVGTGKSDSTPYTPQPVAA